MLIILPTTPVSSDPPVTLGPRGIAEVLPDVVVAEVLPAWVTMSVVSVVVDGALVGVPETAVAVVDVVGVVPIAEVVVVGAAVLEANPVVVGA
jgi:hypothetical protein